VVISDVMMPIMDAKSLLRAMRQDEALKSIPVILISAVRRHVAIPSGDDAPEFSAFLRKPFQLEKLLSTVSSLIGAGRSKGRKIDEPDVAGGWYGEGRANAGRYARGLVDGHHDNAA